MVSSAGVDPEAGKLTLIRPEKATGDEAAMSSPASPAMIPHALSSSTTVKNPAGSSRLVIVRLIGVGVGV